MEIQALVEMCAKAINETPKDSTARIVLKMKPNPRCPRERKLVPTRGKAPVGQFMQQDETHDWYMFDALDVLAWLVANGAAQVEETNCNNAVRIAYQAPDTDAPGG